MVTTKFTTNTSSKPYIPEPDRVKTFHPYPLAKLPARESGPKPNEKFIELATSIMSGNR